jgi:hypothetical protein
MYHRHASSIRLQRRLLPLIRKLERNQRSMPEPQTLKNHARFDPPYHFFLLPILLFNLIFAVTYLIRHWPDHVHLFIWWIVMSIAVILLAFKARAYALQAQDRVIRLEERLRFATLLPAELLARSSALTEAQIIGLRFASDAELPALVKRTLDENLTRKQIKESIVDWKPDYFRV